MYGQDVCSTKGGQVVKVAEFFAGIGLVRLGLEEAGFEVVWANDISPIKHRLYRNQFGAEHYLVRDVRQVTGDDVPTVDLATASFPCIDLSLAGNRGGLRHGPHSSTFWEFVRILGEQGPRRPGLVMVENVTGFVSSHGGEDLHTAIAALNDLGYICDILIIDAKHFVPQSRPRLFLIGSRERLAPNSLWQVSNLRSKQVTTFTHKHTDLALQCPLLPPLPEATHTLAESVERLPDGDPRWWGLAAQTAFLRQLGQRHAERLAALTQQAEITYATAYRRTRAAGPTWEIRDDGLSGCLRAVNGGSSRQAVIEAGQGAWRARWMTGREYANLQGAPRFKIDGVTENQLLHAFGDAVCVPVIAWLAKHYLAPVLSGRLTIGLHQEQLAIA